MDVSPAPVPLDNYQDTQDTQDGIWPNGPVQLARGRQAKDPNAKTVTYSVSSLEDFETSLRAYLNNPPDQPEHTECQLNFWTGASFLVSAPSSTQSSRQQSQHAPPPPLPPQPSHAHAHVQHQQHPHPHPHPQAPPGYQPANGLHPTQYGAPSHVSHTYQSVSDPAIALTLPSHAPSSSGSDRTKDDGPKISLSILEALAPTNDPKEKMRKQRAIAKCCVDAIQKVDGYRYSFHNCWNSREDDSFRFSYYCNDSLLNKDRAANGKGAKLGKRATKPVYDCRGVLSVKFSANKNTLDVFYKHVPIHKTYEERAPPPRKDSKRRRFLEENDPEALIRIANRPKPAKPPEERPPDVVKAKKKKTKQEDEPRKAMNSIESDLRAQSLRSLLELIQVDNAPEPAQEPPPPAPTNAAHEEQPAQQHLQPQVQAHPQPQPQIQPQPQPQQTRPRPRNSCDVCKAKKTKCDGTRPVCQTCSKKNRQCFYSADALVDDRRQSVNNAPQFGQRNEPIRQAQAANSELTELEKMKMELEEAKARIQQLEDEKTRPSVTPSQTPRLQPPPPPRQESKPQSQPHSQSQHLATPQQLQTPQYGHPNAHTTQTPYGLNRNMQYQAALQPSQSSPNQQMHATGSGSMPSRTLSGQAAVIDPTGLPSTQDATIPYSRDFWSNSFYPYQAPQQHQQDQWGNRPPGVFR
ncbi:hypothetical protein BDV96DRAFT_243001 [Lophiotrema nucula]|uniref:Zn(2)-C6 fungal-type domain-containing protein n=1 Tax=Lophiotrema nucula TaxID=690887 RepID=A0A6A5YPT4_9PLEO|nr:hypothetical protein BDV96DRAFT_243001 [Lophiotrema nucula]